MSIFRRKTPSVKVGIAPPTPSPPSEFTFEGRDVTTLEGEERLKDYLYHIHAIQQLALEARMHAYFKRQDEVQREWILEMLREAEDLVEKYKDFKGIPASMKLTQAEKQNNPHLDKEAKASGPKRRKAKKSSKKRHVRKGKSRRGTRKNRK